MTSPECNIIDFNDDDERYQPSTDFNNVQRDSDEDLNDILRNLPTEEVIELDSDSDDLLIKLPPRQILYQTFVLVCPG